MQARKGNSRLCGGELALASGASDDPDPGLPPKGEGEDGKPTQSACFRRKAGISISSMPWLAKASTFAAAVRPLRQTLGVDNAL